mgnify:CR=1 FL=1
MEIIVNWMRKQLLFVMTICMLVGMVGGVLLSYRLWNWRIGELTKVGGFLYDNRVFEVKERVVIVK